MSRRLSAVLARLLDKKRRDTPAASQTPPLPENPYRRFYTSPRRLEDLAPRPPKTKK